MEEAGQNREMIHSLKTGLFGPLAGLGDAIWWYTAMPIIASICCSLATQNNVLGPIFYILFWALTAIFSRIWFVRLAIMPVSTPSSSSAITPLISARLPVFWALWSSAD